MPSSKDSYPHSVCFPGAVADLQARRGGRSEGPRRVPAHGGGCDEGRRVLRDQGVQRREAVAEPRLEQLPLGGDALRQRRQVCECAARSVADGEKSRCEGSAGFERNSWPH